MKIGNKGTGGGSKAFVGYCLLLVLILFFLFVSEEKVFAGSSDISMKISRSQGEKTGIAVPRFIFEGGRDLENFSERSAAILMADLKESGYFKPVSDELVLELEKSDFKRSSIDFNEWKSIGAEGLVKGNISLEGGWIIVEGRLYDVYSGRQILQMRYEGKRREFRKLIHRFSDDIVFKFAGEKGISTTRLVFVSRSGGHKELYLCDYDGKNLNRLTYDSSIALFPKWSPKGKHISYTSFKYRNPDLYLIDLLTMRSSSLSNESGINAPASWSPDGKKFAVSLGRDGNAEIYVLERYRSRMQRLTKRRSIETSPSWSPTGNTIAFTSDRSGGPQIYLMDSDGANLRRVTYKGRYNDQASWSPDGSKIAYSSMNRGHFNIYVISLANNKLSQLTINTGDNQSPTWSPDGRKIAFSSNRNGSYQLYTMDSDGTNQKQLLFLEGGGYDPAWSPRFDEITN